jgi:hypothetical protein
MESKMLAFAEVKEVASEHPNGEFEVVLSAPTLDRDGEVLDGKCFEPLPDHITFDIDHGLSTATTVGSGKPFYDGDLLKVRGTFSSIPRAQEVRTLVNEGHIRTTSVAFRAAEKTTKDGTPHITRAELLNGAFVPVPSNRDALVLSSKGVKAGARHSSADMERIQATHDHMAALGASCGAEKAVTHDAVDEEVDTTAVDDGTETRSVNAEQDATGAADVEAEELELRARALRILKAVSSA